MADAEALLRVFNFRIELYRSLDQVSGAFGTTGAGGAQTEGDSLGDGGFQECSGLEIELDVQELYEGGRNDGVIRRVGRAKYSNIILKRGMFFSTPPNLDARTQYSSTPVPDPSEQSLQRDLWDWLQGIASGGPVPRYDGFIRVLEQIGNEKRTVATWSFVRGLPAKIRGPELNAQTGDIAIEELHIAHEGLRLEVGA